MVTIPIRSNLVVSATIVSQYIASGVSDVVLARCLLPRSLLNLPECFSFHSVILSDEKSGSGSASFSELKNKGLREIISEGTDAIKKFPRVAQGEIGTESLSQNYLRHGGFVLLILYPTVGAVHGVILATFVDRQHHNIVLHG